MKQSYMKNHQSSCRPGLRFLEGGGPVSEELCYSDNYSDEAIRPRKTYYHFESYKDGKVDQKIQLNIFGR